MPLGIGDETLEPAGFELYEGDHAIIAGPSRSGRTTALLVVAEVVARLYPEIRITGIAARRSALRECPVLSRVVTSVDELAELAGELRSADGPQLLLVDDADTVDDPDARLSDLFAAPLGNLHAIVAGRGDALRTLGHWSVGARRVPGGAAAAARCPGRRGAAGGDAAPAAGAAGAAGVRLPDRPGRVRAGPGGPGRRGGRPADWVTRVRLRPGPAFESP